MGRGPTRKEFATDQDVRWCPGCGDYAILASVQTAFAKLGVPREKFVVVSGIGCSSRFPYYMNTYGFHTLHGRAPGVATGIKLTRPDLSVWVVTGDGDALAIGAGHLLHALRRNVGIRILLFNNRIYGLTKGQASPTSETGKTTPSTPGGVADRPFRPVALALAAGATFVARSVDRFGAHLQEMIERAARHEGAALIEILQNCNIFNDGAFAEVTGRAGREENVLYLEHGRPLRFGPDGSRGLALDGAGGLVEVDPGQAPGRVLVHDERAPDSAVPDLLARLDAPVPLGVFRDVSAPALEQVLRERREAARRARDGGLAELLAGPNAWTVP
ncbi:MAG: 2-oxoacid:ferredoxin oxidoreductase subunit beta [Acidobacteriota bacterium]|nr:MAG: 2-oxoacid:ferredoxin oxidoreductase subunit beta [Acidobacteriota bacterium]